MLFSCSTAYLGSVCKNLERCHNFFFFLAQFLGVDFWGILPANVSMTQYVIQDRISSSNSYNMETEIPSSLSFSFFQNSIIFRFCFDLEVTHRNQWESKIPFIVLSPIGQLLILENHNICKDRLQYYSKKLCKSLLRKLMNNFMKKKN